MSTPQQSTPLCEDDPVARFRFHRDKALAHAGAVRQSSRDYFRSVSAAGHELSIIRPTFQHGEWGAFCEAERVSQETMRKWRLLADAYPPNSNRLEFALGEFEGSIRKALAAIPKPKPKPPPELPSPPAEPPSSPDDEYAEAVTRGETEPTTEREGDPLAAVTAELEHERAEKEAIEERLAIVAAEVDEGAAVKRQEQIDRQRKEIERLRSLVRRRDKTIAGMVRAVQDGWRPSLILQKFAGHAVTD